jgi:hypothetical protein
MQHEQGRPMNIAIITIDSLRYDTALQAGTPNLDRLLAVLEDVIRAVMRLWHFFERRKS